MSLGTRKVPVGILFINLIDFPNCAGGKLLNIKYVMGKLDIRCWFFYKISIITTL